MGKPIKTICACCIKVLQGDDRQNPDNWKHQPWDYSVDYSHGYCPKCFDVEMEKVNQYMNSKG